MKWIPFVKKYISRLRHPIPTLCYGLTLLGWLVWGLACLGGDALAQANGTLTVQELTPDDFLLVNLEPQADGTLYTLNSDPQMILEDTADQTVRSVSFSADFTRDAREMCLYYTTAPGVDFSQDMRVFAVEREGSYVYTLPRKKIYSLRLDPCSPAQNELLNMTVHSIRLNEPQSALRCFLPGWDGAFRLILYPGMAAALLRILQQLATMAFSGTFGKSTSHRHSHPKKRPHSRKKK